MMIRIVCKCACLLYLFSSFITGCSRIPDTSPLPTPDPKCNPQKVFPKGLPLLKQQLYQVFTKSQAHPMEEEYGCLGITWVGKTGDPLGYLVKVKKDGSYLVQDPQTKKFSEQKLGATISAGVDKVEMFIMIFKAANQAAALKWNCTAKVSAKVRGCWADSDCVFAWNYKDVPVSSSGGQCQLCSRERCNGQDDNCDGQVDEASGKDSACGFQLGKACTFVKEVNAQTKGCDANGRCSCLTDAKGVTYICASSQKDKGHAWTPVNQIAELCKKPGVLASGGHSGKLYYCGKAGLLCDRCEGKQMIWRLAVADGCTHGTVIPQ